MKCMVCGETIEGEICPFCGFPVYEIVGDNLEESVAQIRKLASEYRSGYLHDIKAGIVIHEWKEKNGEIAEKKRTEVMFADGSELEKGEVWLSQELARIPDEKSIQAEVVISKGGKKQVHKVEISNLLEKELQMIGFQLKEPLHLCLMLKNKSNSSISKPISLVEYKRD